MSGFGLGFSHQEIIDKCRIVVTKNDDGGVVGHIVNIDKLESGGGGGRGKFKKVLRKIQAVKMMENDNITKADSRAEKKLPLIGGRFLYLPKFGKN